MASSWIGTAIPGGGIGPGGPIRGPRRKDNIDKGRSKKIKDLKSLSQKKEQQKTENGDSVKDKKGD